MGMLEKKRNPPGAGLARKSRHAVPSRSRSLRQAAREHGKGGGPGSWTPERRQRVGWGGVGWWCGLRRRPDPSPPGPGPAASPGRPRLDPPHPGPGHPVPRLPGPGRRAPPHPGPVAARTGPAGSPDLAIRSRQALGPGRLDPPDSGTGAPESGRRPGGVGAFRVGCRTPTAAWCAGQALPRAPARVRPVALAFVLCRAVPSRARASCAPRAGGALPHPPYTAGPSPACRTLRALTPAAARPPGAGVSPARPPDAGGLCRPPAGHCGGLPRPPGAGRAGRSVTLPGVFRGPGGCCGVRSGARRGERAVGRACTAAGAAQSRRPHRPLPLLPSSPLRGWVRVRPPPCSAAAGEHAPGGGAGRVVVSWWRRAVR